MSRCEAWLYGFDASYGLRSHATTGDEDWQISNLAAQLRTIRDCGTTNRARAAGHFLTACIDGHDAKQLHTCMVMES